MSHYSWLLVCVVLAHEILWGFCLFVVWRLKTANYDFFEMYIVRMLAIVFIVIAPILNGMRILFSEATPPPINLLSICSEAVSLIIPVIWLVGLPIIALSKKKGQDLDF